jgi:hypothetical protein
VSAFVPKQIREQRARLEREADLILKQARLKPIARRKLKLKSEPMPRVLHLTDLGALRARGLLP